MYFGAGYLGGYVSNKQNVSSVVEICTVQLGLVNNLLTGTWIRCSEWPNPSRWPSSPWWHQIPQHLSMKSRKLWQKISPTKHLPSHQPNRWSEAQAQTEPNREREPGDDQQDGEFAEVRISWCEKLGKLHRVFSSESIFSENFRELQIFLSWLWLYPIRPQPWKIVSSFSEFSLIWILVAQEP